MPMLSRLWLFEIELVTLICCIQNNQSLIVEVHLMVPLIKNLDLLSTSVVSLVIIKIIL